MATCNVQYAAFESGFYGDAKLGKNKKLGDIIYMSTALNIILYNPMSMILAFCHTTTLIISFFFSSMLLLHLHCRELSTAFFLISEGKMKVTYY